MNLVLEFHDSEVRIVQPLDAALSVQFSAASVRSAQQGGPPIGHVLNLEMLLSGCDRPASVAGCVGRLATGMLCVDGASLMPVPLPFAGHGKVAVTLDFANGSSLTAAGESVEIRFAGDPRFVESYAC